MVLRTDGSSKEIPTMVVNGLVKMNKQEIADLRFIKGLLIGFCTVDKIKKNISIEDVDEGVLTLIKGMLLLI